MAEALAIYLTLLIYGYAWALVFIVKDWRQGVAWLLLMAIWPLWVLAFLLSEIRDWWVCWKWVCHG